MLNEWPLEVLDGANASRIRVLIVDDHRMFADSIAIRLSAEADLEVIGWAGDGSTGVHEARRSHPDVAIVDTPLPDRDGPGAAADILEASPDTQILMLTRPQDNGMVRAAISAGCGGFITRDENTAELVAAVRQVASGEAYIPAQLASRLMARRNGVARTVGDDLTRRELEVLTMLAAGTPTAEIAASLFVSVNTVRQHVHRILNKLNAHSKLEAVAIAVREGIVARS